MAAHCGFARCSKIFRHSTLSSIKAVIALKKGAYLLKYGRRGKPKFCPFRLSNVALESLGIMVKLIYWEMVSKVRVAETSSPLVGDESVLIWYSGKVEKQLVLNNVSKIIPGQRTAIFKRYPRPDKEYQSFSLIYSDRSLDLICKDKVETEVWFIGLKALISHRNYQRWRLESSADRISDASSQGVQTGSNALLASTFGSNIDKGRGSQRIHVENIPTDGCGKVFSDVILCTAARSSFHSDSVSNPRSSLSSLCADNSNGQSSAVETFRVSLSSAISSSSHGSGCDDFDALGDVFFWGEGIGEGILGGGLHKLRNPFSTKFDAPLPKALESVVLLDIHYIACGSRHAALVTRQGEVFCWGEESGGRLGHGVDVDVSHPKVVDAFEGMNIGFVACGEHHTCAVTLSGDLYTWGNGIHTSGLLGHGSEASHCIPKQVIGKLDGLHVSSVSCGPWHTAVVTSSGQLFTFGDGIFGALGHGDRGSANMPREVEALKGMRTITAACGVWHTAAVVEISVESMDSCDTPSGRLFTWGDGDKGRLGHGDREHRFLPACIVSLAEPSFSQVACGNDITVALTTSGNVFAMGSNVHGQLGNPEANGKLPTCIEGKLGSSFVEEIACGSYHVAVLTSKSEVYTWGKGANGRLGHGDNLDRNTPTLVEALKDKQVKSVVCGSDFTAVICLHKWMSSADQSICSGCRLPFGFRRKRHNCYNCGLVFCKSCSSKKSVKASLAPNMRKPYRVCDECYTKLKKTTGFGLILKQHNGNQNQILNELAEKEQLDPRFHGQYPRLSSSESFKAEGRNLTQNWKFESRIPPNSTGISPWKRFFKSRSSKNLYESSKKMFSASVPVSRVASRSTSPVLSVSSPPHPTALLTVNGTASLEATSDSSKKTDDSLSQEVVRLKLQVKDLIHKSQLLEAELERTSKQLKAATTLTGEETAKCSAAKEVIKSLTVQLKDMVETESVPEGNATSYNVGHNESETSTFSKLARDENNASSLMKTQITESTGYSNDSLPCDTTRSLAAETEWIEQAEAGVYITVSSSSEGEACLKQIRFSRKRFTEQEAEKWWAENRSVLQDKYRIPVGGRSTNGLDSASDRKDAVISRQY